MQEVGRDDKPSAVPCRITVVNAEGALVTTGAASGPGLAVRPGVLYTADGKARFGLPAGDYTVYAGRGFEYGIDSVRLSLAAGDSVRKVLRIRREDDYDPALLRAAEEQLELEEARLLRACHGPGPKPSARRPP